MIHRKTLTEGDARYAMSNGDFPQSVAASRDFVAVILTQSWCPDWTWMRDWLDRQGSGGQADPEEMEIDVYELEYNRVDYFEEFRHFKERTFANDLIPYVRYYVRGRFVGDSNQVSAKAFYSRFRGQCSDGA